TIRIIRAIRVQKRRLPHEVLCLDGLLGGFAGMRKLWCFGLVLLLASACQSAGSQATATFIPSPVIGATATLASPIVTSATGTPGATPSGAVATVARPTPGAAGPFTITAGDGVKLAAVYYPP